jgi:hypothetical protein
LDKVEDTANDEKIIKDLERLKEQLSIKETENKKLQTKLDRVCNDTE